MGVTCIFGLVDVSLSSTRRELVTGPIVTWLAMLFLWAFPLAPGAFMSCPTMDFPREDNFIDAGYGTPHCLCELMNHLQRSWICTNLPRSQFSHLQKAGRKSKHGHHGGKPHASRNLLMGFPLLCVTRIRSNYPMYHYTLRFARSRTYASQACPQCDP